MKESARSVKERAAHVKEPATPSKFVARVPRVSPRPKGKAFCVCGWSEDAWDAARPNILVGSFETTDERFEVKVPSTAVMDMSGISASTSVSIVVAVPADNSPPTLRAEALSPSNGPTTSVSLASLNSTFDEDIQFEGTRTVDMCTNSVAASGAGCAHAKYADGSFAVHPVTSENVSWRTLVVVLDQELHPNQTVHILIDARAVRDSSGNPFVGLAGRDVNFVVAEQVIVPNGSVAFQVLRLPLWSRSLNACSLLVEMILSVLPFGVVQRFCVARTQ